MGERNSFPLSNDAAFERTGCLIGFQHSASLFRDLSGHAERLDELLDGIAKLVDKLHFALTREIIFLDEISCSHI